MKKLYYVSVAVTNKKLGITEDVKHGIIAESPEDALMKAKEFGTVLYVHGKSYELNKDWE